MKTQLNEMKRMQQLAGLLNETTKYNIFEGYMKTNDFQDELEGNQFIYLGTKYTIVFIKTEEDLKSNGFAVYDIVLRSNGNKDQKIGSKYFGRQQSLEDFIRDFNIDQDGMPSLAFDQVEESSLNEVKRMQKLAGLLTEEEMMNPTKKRGDTIGLSLLLRDLYEKSLNDKTPFLGGYYLDYNFDSPHQLVLYIAKAPFEYKQRVQDIEKLGTAVCINGEWSFDSGVKPSNGDQAILDKIAKEAFPSVSENQLPTSVPPLDSDTKNAIDNKVANLSPEQISQLQAELSKIGITADSSTSDIAKKIDLPVNEAEDDGKSTKEKVADVLDGIGSGLIGTMLVPIIPVALGHYTGMGVAAGFAVTFATITLLKGLADSLNKQAEKEKQA